MASPVDDSSFFLTHFILSLTRTVSVSRFYQLLGRMVKVEMQQDQVVGIAGLNSDHFFNLLPALKILADYKYITRRNSRSKGYSLHLS